MKKALLLCAIALSFTLGACDTSEVPVSVDSMHDATDLQEIGPGVSSGAVGAQDVVYVRGQEGKSWLHQQTQRERDALAAQYDLTRDASLLPRLKHLETTLQITGNSPSSDFVITSIPPDDEQLPVDPPAGPSCSGGGSTCNCRAGCLCVSADNGCACQCPN